MNGQSNETESFRLVLGFNDIFVAIACLLCLVSLAILGNHWFSGAGYLAVAVASWLIAQWYVAKRRLALPAVVLALAFGFACFSALQTFTENLVPNNEIIAFAATAALAYVFWRKFRFAISFTVFVCAVVAFLVALLVLVFPDLRSQQSAIAFVAGIGLFVLGLYWDSLDRARLTDRADIAFWLHLACAPMLVHPLFLWIGIMSKAEITAAVGAIVVALYLLISFVSLAINRRALMVSALLYVVIVIGALFKQDGKVALGFAAAALLVGVSLLVVSAFWAPLRQNILGFLPKPLVARLPSIH